MTSTFGRSAAKADVAIASPTTRHPPLRIDWIIGPACSRAAKMVAACPGSDSQKNEPKRTGSSTTLLRTDVRPRWREDRPGGVSSDAFGVVCYNPFPTSPGRPAEDGSGPRPSMAPHDENPSRHAHRPHGHRDAGPAAEHRARGRSARCRVITVSDTRTLETDTSGARAAELLIAAGHSIAARRIVPDEREEIARAVRDALDDPDTDAVILSGGTGLAPRDVTYETVRDLLEK